MHNTVNQRNANQNHNEIYLTFVRMAIIIKNTNNKCLPGCKKPLYTSGRHVNWSSHYGKQYGGSSKNYDIVIPFLSIYPKKSKTLIQKDTCTPTFTKALVTIAGRCGSKLSVHQQINKEDMIHTTTILLSHKTESKLSFLAT